MKFFIIVFIIICAAATIFAESAHIHVTATVIDPLQAMYIDSMLVDSLGKYSTININDFETIVTTTIDTDSNIVITTTIVGL